MASEEQTAASSTPPTMARPEVQSPTQIEVGAGEDVTQDQLNVLYEGIGELMESARETKKAQEIQSAQILDLRNAMKNQSKVSEEIISKTMEEEKEAIKKVMEEAKKESDNQETRANKIVSEIKAAATESSAEMMRLQEFVTQSVVDLSSKMESDYEKLMATVEGRAFPEREQDDKRREKDDKRYKLLKES